jgi:hypothetical protein
MEFIYRLTGAGWAEARIADASSTATVTASYLSDALRDLLRAVLLLLEGAAEARCSWEEEPGEFRWVLTRAGNGQVDLKILAFDDLWAAPDRKAEDGAQARFANEPDDQGELLFLTSQPLGVLARAIADGAAAVLAEHGEEGYLAEWGLAAFPTADLVAIQEHVQRSAPASEPR